MIGALLELVPVELLIGAVTTIAALVWGALGRRSARREGERKATDRIAREITEADYDTREDIQRALNSHSHDRDRARERLRERLDRGSRG